MRNVALIVGGGIVALYLYSRYRAGTRATFYLRSTKPGGSVLAPVLNVELAVQNPTGNTITIKSISGNILFSGSPIANISAFGDQIVQANSESVLRLVARPSVIGILTSIRDILDQPVSNANIRFVGRANVDGIVVPIDVTKQI
jgi:hypothetical protein